MSQAHLHAPILLAGMSTCAACLVDEKAQEEGGSERCLVWYVCRSIEREGQPPLFFHVSEVADSSAAEVASGAEVAFSVVPDAAGKYTAVALELLPTGTVAEERRWPGQQPKSLNSHRSVTSCLTERRSYRRMLHTLGCQGDCRVHLVFSDTLGVSQSSACCWTLSQCHNFSGSSFSKTSATGCCRFKCVGIEASRLYTYMKVLSKQLTDLWLRLP